MHSVPSHHGHLEAREPFVGSNKFVVYMFLLMGMVMTAMLVAVGANFLRVFVLKVFKTSLNDFNKL